MKLIIKKISAILAITIKIIFADKEFLNNEIFTLEGIKVKQVFANGAMIVTGIMLIVPAMVPDLRPGFGYYTLAVGIGATISVTLLNMYRNDVDKDSNEKAQDRLLEVVKNISDKLQPQSADDFVSESFQKVEGGIANHSVEGLPEEEKI